MLLSIARAARRGLAELAFERRDGLCTGGIRHPQQLGYAEEGDYHRYEPLGWLVLRKILRPAEVGSDDVFADLGAGMGRVLFQAARYPFRRVIGVELSPDLAGIAQDNVARMRRRGRGDVIEVVNADVPTWQIPDDLTVVFLNNPFGGATFSCCAERLIASVDRRPRRLRLIYLNPVEHERLLATGRFRPMRRARPRWPAPRREERSSWTIMYEVAPRTS